ncbi:MAG: M18 family aminopeptidase [Clostridiales bacterium]|nr:M18 family aminopeptidase [Clostridiales bacterium]
MQKTAPEIEQLFQYLSSGVSAFHVVAHSRKVLLDAGFTELKLKDTWRLEKGGRYFCCPFDTTLYAFTIGNECDLANGIHIAGAHTDFPAIKIKPNPEIFSHGYMQLNTEVYGGPILNTFFDRPLSLAGKVVLRGERYDRPDVHLIDFRRPILYLPNLAIHMNRGVNENGAPIDNQKHLLPIIGMTDDQTGNLCEKTFPLNKNTTFLEILASELNVNPHDILASELNVDPHDILDYDLCIYNTEQPACVGINSEFISAPRLDDITSVCALIYGLINSQNADRVNLVCLFDNEEIGSLSKQGADSSLPAVIIGKIWQSFGKNQTDCMADIAGGMMLSADVAHAYHPNHPASQDITNYPVLNRGLVLKTASNQSYSWDSEILGSLIDLCTREHIPYQRFVKHSNTRGGGTIGSIISSHLPMRTADVGVGLLAMHSSREVMGGSDQLALTRLAEAFFSN